MPRHTENLDLGLFTAPDPSKLEPGQLSYLQNGIYLPGSQALQRAKGRILFGQVTATGFDVDGLRDVQFDNSDQYLIAMVSGTAAGNGAYQIASITGTGVSGTFSTLVSGITAGAQLEVAHYRNRFFLFNGAEAAVSSIGSNRVIYLSATATGTAPSLRQHGMLPVEAAPFITTAAGTFSQTVTGYFEYWTTEVAQITADGVRQVLESTFIGKPTTVLVSSVSVVPVIQIPSVRNAITTHWRIYRSPAKSKESDTKFPSGFAISNDLATGTTTQSDTLATASAGSVPSLFNNPIGTQAYSDASANASGVTAAGGGAAILTAAVGLGGVTLPKSQGFYGFNFGGFAGNVKGVEVLVSATINAGVTASGCPISVTIGSPRSTVTFPGGFGFHPILAGDYLWNRLKPSTTPQPATKSGLITATGAGVQALTFGSPTDRWSPGNGVGMADSDFTSAGFMVVLSHTNKLSTLSIDFLKATVYYGATIDGTVQFPTVVYTFGDITSQVGKNGPPPSSTTGDIYEDALVVNDVTNPALIRYSAPGEPESFPETYFLDFETRDNDIVTLIKTVNQRLIVGLETSMYRANYLPSERDASFDRGKAIECISPSYGCVNPMCAAVFSRDGGTSTLAFVSDHGIHGTDGYSFDTYTDGLNWGNIISRTSTSNAICLINDRDKQELLFYYRNDANGNETYLCLHLSYATEHLTNGKPKVSGPVHVRNYNSTGPVRASLESAWTARRTSGQQDVFLGYGGTATAAGGGSVYIETGTTIPAEDSTLKYATRRMYLAELAHEWRLNELYGYVGSYSGSPAITYSLNNTKTNDSGPTGVGSKSITLSGQKLHKVQFQQMAEGLIVTGQVTASAFAQESIILDGEGFGLEDSGR